MKNFAIREITIIALTVVLTLVFGYLVMKDSRGGVLIMEAGVNFVGS